MNQRFYSQYSKLSLLLLISFCALRPYGSIQAQSLVIDAEHTAAKGIQGFFAMSSAVLKKVVEAPAWEKISKVQEFLQDASTVISRVVKNLKMTKELIALEEEIRESLTLYYQILNEAEHFPTKFIHHRTLVELWYEVGQIFEIFDFATATNRGIVDDEGRILLIRDTLIKAKKIRNSMRVVMRKARKDLLLYQKTEKEVEGFTMLFGFE